MWAALRDTASRVEVSADGADGPDLAREEVAALIPRVDPVWRAFADLHRVARECRLHSDAEVEELCGACGRVSATARVAYPDVHIQLKIHLIEAHLVPFVRRWRSAGLFFEDACESIHALVNGLNRRFACLHGDAKAASKAAALEILARQDLQAIGRARRSRRARGPYKNKSSAMKATELEAAQQ